MGLTPNTLTVIGFITSSLAAVAYMNVKSNKVYLIAASILILLSGFIDTLDGILARHTGKESIFGGFFDSVVDRFSDAVVLMAIIVSGLCNVGWGLAAMVGSLMVSYSRARAEASGVKMISVGFAERAERMLLLVVVTLGAYFNFVLLRWGIILLAILTHFTVLQRGRHFYEETEKG